MGIIAPRLSVLDLSPGPARTVYSIAIDMHKNRLLSAPLVLDRAERAASGDKHMTQYLDALRGGVIPQETGALLNMIEAVQNDAQVRRLRGELADIQKQLAEPEARANVLGAHAIRTIQETVRSSAQSEGRMAKEYSDKAREAFDNWGRGIVSGNSSGIPEFDKILRWNRKEHIVVAGRPGMGKTTIVLQQVINAAVQLWNDNDNRVIRFFSLEMPGENIYHKGAAMIGGVDFSKIRDNKASQEERKAFSAGMDMMDNLNLIIDDRSNATPDQIRYSVMADSASHDGVYAFVVDNFSLVRPNPYDDAAKKSRIVRVGEASLAIVDAAKESDTTGIAISHLNRECESTDSKVPLLSHLKESGDVEQNADAVMFILRPDYYFGQGQKSFLDSTAGDVKRWESHPHVGSNWIYAFVPKNRLGHTGRINARMNPDTFRIEGVQFQDSREELDY